MNTKKAAELLLDKVATAPSVKKSKRDPEGKGVEHAIWMLVGIKLGYIQHEKSHRWLGYAQGLLVGENVISLEVAKTANKQATE